MPESIASESLLPQQANLARLLARRTEGIFIAPFEQGEIGPDEGLRVRARGPGLEAP
jgi:hypothetical protein